MDVSEKLVELLYNSPQLDVLGGLSYYEEAANHLIANGVTVQEWISVTERLPEECPHPYDDMTKAVLIYTPVDGYTHIGWYAGKDYRGRDVWKTLSAMRSWQTCTKKVTHWQYLPQPPKGE